MKCAREQVLPTVVCIALDIRALLKLLSTCITLSIACSLPLSFGYLFILLCIKFIDEIKRFLFVFDICIFSVSLSLYLSCIMNIWLSDAFVAIKREKKLKFLPLFLFIFEWYVLWTLDSSIFQRTNHCCPFFFFNCLFHFDYIF